MGMIAPPGYPKIMEVPSLSKDCITASDPLILLVSLFFSVISNCDCGSITLMVAFEKNFDLLSCGGAGKCHIRGFVINDATLLLTVPPPAYIILTAPLSAEETMEA